MNNTRLFNVFTAFALTGIILILSQPIMAAQGGWSMGLNLGITNADQKDMNRVIESAGGSKMGNSWEGAAQLGYRFSSTSLIFRASYIFNTEESGANEFAINGYTFFPILRFHLLENNTIKFFANLGVGFGWLNGEIKEAAATTEFSGNDFGYMGGLGAEFCFWGDHCINVEGNVRLLAIDRTTVDKASGASGIGAITQRDKGAELEINNRDFGMSLSGIQGFVGYTMYF